jgi:hypothetical protein
VIIEGSGETDVSFQTDDLRELLLVDGTLVALGSTAGVVGDANAGGMDMYMQALANDGSVVATEQFGTTGDDRFHQAALRSDGNLVMVGEFGATFNGVDGLAVGVIAPPSP